MNMDSKPGDATMGKETSSSEWIRYIYHTCATVRIGLDLLAKIMQQNGESFSPEDLWNTLAQTEKTK